MVQRPTQIQSAQCLAESGRRGPSRSQSAARAGAISQIPPANRTRRCPPRNRGYAPQSFAHHYQNWAGVRCLPPPGDAHRPEPPTLHRYRPSVRPGASEPVDWPSGYRTDVLAPHHEPPHPPDCGSGSAGGPPHPLDRLTVTSGCEYYLQLPRPKRKEERPEHRIRDAFLFLQEQRHPLPAHSPERNQPQPTAHSLAAGR